MPAPHISVCICTFKRSAMLAELLRTLQSQKTDDLFTFDIVVADNDAAASARQAVADVAAASRVRVTYVVEPVANIARARNAAVAGATGDFIAFVDDDEVPQNDWLLELFKARERYAVDAVLGPVMSRFETPPPEWVKKGGFFDRPRFATGTPIQWPNARSGNVLFVRALLQKLDPPFRPEFATAGEDVDFFRRLAEHGCRFVWCDEAPVFEIVPPSRATRGFLLRRAMLRGSNFHKHPTNRLKNAVKSLIAVPCYTIALPLLALAGQHLFVAYLVKILDHASRLLAFAGLPLVSERET
jgi:succinoglycan biosynthesis protein ExoM